MDLAQLKTLVMRNDSAFWSALGQATAQAREFSDLIALSALRKKAVACGLNRPGDVPKSLRLAILGGCSLYPLHELLTHMLEASEISCELFVSDYDNYVSEIMDTDSALYQFKPQVVLLLPSLQRCKYSGALTDKRGAIQTCATASATQ